MIPEHQSRTLHRKNTFLAIVDRTAKNDYSLALLIEDVSENSNFAKVIFLVRDPSNSKNFNPVSEGQVPVVNILCSVNDAKMKKIVSEEGQKVVVVLKVNARERLEEEVKKILAEREMGDEIFESDESDEEDISEFEDASQILSSVLPGLSKKKSGRGTKRSASTRGAKAAKGGAKGAKKPKEPVPKFKRGVSNPLVQYIDHSEQFHRQETTPDFSCCAVCNNKELIRAVFANSPILLEKILSQKDKIFSVNTPMGPNNIVTPMTASIAFGRLDFFYNLLAEQADVASNARRARATSQINFIETGHNSKYAYGVATRQVDMGRKNREGNNAFTYDNAVPQNFEHDPKSLNFLFSKLDSEEVLLRLWSLDASLSNTMKAKFIEIVFAGNFELAVIVMRYICEAGGWGTSPFHYLALSAASVAELEAAGLRKINVKKKSNLSGVSPLHLSALNPNIEVFEKFLDLSEDAYPVDEQLRKPVHYAAVASTPAAIEALHRRGVDLRDQDKNKINPLMLAASAGKHENLRRITELVQCNLNQKSKLGFSALHYAVLNDHRDTVAALLSLGADPNQQGSKGLTPIMMACQHGNLDVVQLLIASGGKIIKGDKHQKSALIHAVISGDLPLVSYILTRGAEFNRPDSSGNTPLHYAAAYGFYDMIPLLLQAGANINAINSWNMPPVLIAMMKGHYRIMKLFTKYPSLNINCQDSEGYTLLMRTVSSLNEQSLAFAEFLIKEKGADPNLQNTAGKNCLHVLAELKISRPDSDSYAEYKAERAKQKNIYRQFFEVLVAGGGLLEQKDESENTPISLALSQKNLLFLELIAEKSPDLTQKVAGGGTLLHSLVALLPMRRFAGVAGRLLGVDRLSREGLKAQSRVFDDDGLNFFHRLVLELSRSPTKDLIARLSEKEVRLRNLLDKKNTPSEERKTIEAKLSELAARRNDATRLVTQNFSDFLEILKKFGFDFAERVQLVRKKFVQSAKNPSKSSRRRGTYYFQRYEPSQTLNPGNFAPIAPSQPLPDFTTNDHAECTNFHLAALSGNSQVFEAIEHAAGAYTSNTLNFYGESVLHYLLQAEGASPQLLGRLLTAGEDPNIADFDHNSPLLLAAQAGKTAYVHRLLDAGAKPNLRNKKGLSPLLFAAKNRNVGLMKLLLKSPKCDPNILDLRGRNAFHWSVISGQGRDINPEQELLLFHAGVNANAIDSDFCTPLHYFFITPEDPFITSKIDPVENFADFLNLVKPKIDLPDRFGNTPLIYAAQRGSYLCATLLLKNGADLNFANKQGNYPLAISITCNHFEVAALFLHKSADINRSVPLVNFEFQKTDLNEQEQKQKLESIIQVENPVIEIRQKDLGEYLSKCQPTNQSMNYFGSSRKNQEATQSEKEKEELRKNNYIYEKSSLIEQSMKFNANAVTYLLIENGFDIGQAVFTALASSRFNYALKLLRKRIDPDEKKNASFFHSTDKEKMNILHCFCNMSTLITDPEIKTFLLNEILQKNIPFDNVNEDGKTPLHYLAINKDFACLETFIDKGANFKIADKFGNSIVSCLIQDCPSLKRKRFKDPMGAEERQTATTFRPGRRRPIPSELIDEAEDLLGSEGPIKVNGILENIGYLIKKYKLPLDAAFTEQPEKRTLVRVSQEFFTLLTYSLLKLRNLNLFELLVSHGANINQADDKGFTPMTYAVKLNSAILLHQMRKHENLIDFKVRDRSGKTLVHHCVTPIPFASFQNDQLLAYLASKSDINVEDNDRNPPIYYATLQENKTLYNKLVELNAKEPKNNAKIKRLASSKIINAPMLTMDFDVNEDYQKYIAVMKEKLKKEKVDIEEDFENDERVQGKVKILLDDKSCPYAINLAKVDINYGQYSTNLFYKMHIYEEQVRKVYILFTNWGRMGEEGQYQFTPYFSKLDCIQEFKKIFKEKTSNEYENRANFAQVSQKYRYVPTVPRIKHKQIIKDWELVAKDVPKSKLSPQLFRFAANLLDNKYLQVVYSRFNFDQDVLPFGWLSKEQIAKAKNLIEQIRDLILAMDSQKKGALSYKQIFEVSTQISEMTSRYLEILPAAMNRTGYIPAFNASSVDNEILRVSDLENFELVIELMCAAQLRLKEIHPYDYCFSALDIKIDALDRSDDEFKLLQTYVDSCWEDSDGFAISNIFALEREGDIERFARWRENPSRRLLFHGTRTENLMAILKNGLRIAPMDAQHTGSSMGKGIYFTDCFQRGLDFSSTKLTNSKYSVYVLVAEVALGKMDKHYKAFDLKKLAENCQAVKFIGRQHHDKDLNAYTNSNIMVPLGEMITRTAPKDKAITYFEREFNEFVVYDASQVKLRYIIEVSVGADADF